MYQIKAPKNMKLSFANACVVQDLPDCKDNLTNTLPLATLCNIAEIESVILTNNNGYLKRKSLCEIFLTSCDKVLWIHMHVSIHF